MSVPVWAGVVVRMSDGSIMTWQLNAADGPLRIETSMSMPQATLLDIIHGYQPANGDMQLDLRISGRAIRWDQGAGAVPEPRRAIEDGSGWMLEE